MKAPDFSLPDQTGNIHALSDYRNRWLVVYFYPKDDTPGCTKEACGFRDRSHQIEELGAAVLGVSKDSVQSHARFNAKYRLNFPLLSDPSAAIIKAFGAWGEKRFMGKVFSGTLRKTYLIDPKGEIVKTWDKVDPVTHGEEVIKELTSRL